MASKFEHCQKKYFICYKNISTLPTRMQVLLISALWLIGPRICKWKKAINLIFRTFPLIYGTLYFYIFPEKAKVKEETHVGSFLLQKMRTCWYNMVRVRQHNKSAACKNQIVQII